MNLKINGFQNQSFLLSNPTFHLPANKRFFLASSLLQGDMIIRELRVVSCELRVVSCELSVASCQLQVVSCELLVASWFLLCELRVASCELKVVSCELQVGSTSYQFILYFCSNFRF